MEAIAKTIIQLAPSGVQSFGQLSVVPLVCPNSPRPDYLTLGEAIDAKLVKVSETSRQGSVPELLIENTGAQAVLLLDGEELVGAKQNRIVNLSILVPAYTDLTIPVSCVEAGRWRHDSSQFEVADRAMFSRARARKSGDVTASLRDHGKRASRQGEVWDDIARKSARMACHSDTDAMAAMFESRRSDLEAYVQAFSGIPEQVGGVFFLGSEVAGIEVFDCAQTLHRMLPKLVRSYALDALELPDTPKQSSPATVGEAREALVRVATACYREFPAIGEGSDLRLDDPGLSGGALAARSRIVHLCAFPVEAEDGTRERMPTRRFYD